MNTIQEDMMNPKLLYCSYFSQGMHMTKGKTLHRRTLYDYEFEMIMDSHGGGMWIDDQKVQVEKGDNSFDSQGKPQEVSCRIIVFGYAFNFCNQKKVLNGIIFTMNTKL